MAAITGATTTTSLTELVPAEELVGLGDVARAVDVADLVAFPMAMSGGNTVNLPLLTDAAVPTSESSGKTQTDEFAATEQTATEASLSAATVGIRKAPSDELRLFSPYSIDAALIMDSIGAMREQYNEDVLSRFTDAGNTSNFSGLDLTIERLGAAIAALRLRNGPGSVLICFHETALEDLKASHRSAGLGYGLAMSAQIQRLLDAQARGVVGEFENAPVIATTETPQFDANNWSSAVVKRGSTANNSGLAVGVWRELVFENERQGIRLADNYMTHSIYGSTLVRDDCIQEVVSSKT